MIGLAYPVTVVGVGPGSREYLLPAAATAVDDAEVLVGGRSALAHFASSGKEQFRIGGDLAEVLDFIADARQERRVAVLLSGDPGFFSLLPRLRARFGAKNLKVVPGISSLQVACARLSLDWHDLHTVSVHGRGLEELEAACEFPGVAVLTAPQNPPAAVCRFFLERGCRFECVWVLTDLGLSKEMVTATTLAGGVGLAGRGNSIVILLREPGDFSAANIPDLGWDSEYFPAANLPGMGEEKPAVPEDSAARRSEAVTPGLPNELFARGKAAMSQEEVRALTLCKAQLKRGMTVLEIGAGAGSWTVETARLIRPGVVWAVEKDATAAALVRENIERFGISNVVLVEGEAPAACKGVPQADRILIGGSGGRTGEILATAQEWLRPGGMLVITAVTPETFCTAWQLLQKEDWQLCETIMLNVGRVAPRGTARIWQGENPVFILRARHTTGGEKGV